MGFWDAARALITNSTSTLRDLDTVTGLNLSHGGKRDLDSIYGYTTGGRSYQDYYERYRYTGYGNRIVSAPARSCWRDGAVIKSQSEDGQLVLEEEIQILSRGGMFRVLEQADVLNRIGEFSVMLVGLPGDGELTEPLMNASVKGDLSGVYFSAFAQSAVAVTQYDQNMSSPRYGLPVMYTITPNSSDAKTSSSSTDVREPENVHWSRVVRIAEGSLDNSLVGVSSLDPVFNRIDDLNKATGGAAEAFYRNCMQKFGIKIDKDTKYTAADIASLNTAMQEFTNEQKQFIMTQGGETKALPVQIGSPKDSISVAVDELCAATGIPRRILTGEGGGQLKGTEDKASYNQLISDRQQQICAPALFEVLEILDVAGLLELRDEYVIEWPNPTAMDDLTQSEVALNKARTAKEIAGAAAILDASGLHDDVVASLLEGVGG